MASSSSSSAVQKSFKYDVFLSFRGEDTRKNFVDHLYHALEQNGILTYKDDERIEKGKRIDDQLLRSIEDSRYHMIVFSKNYASSSWCLDELVKIMECQRAGEQTAYPIFYDVEPTHVRKQSGPVGKAIAKHEIIMNTRRWRRALKEAASLAGLELKNTRDGHEARFIEEIVHDISLKLRLINLSVDEKLVGMKTWINSVVSSLNIGYDEDVRMVGIKGMGGGGKTTLARAVFDALSFGFEGKKFVENVREVSKGSLSGLGKLQEQILQDVLKDKSIDVNSVFDGKNMMRNRMPSRKVLLVLDDVDDLSQLEALADDPAWFKPGSRIIITTRDEHVLIAHGKKFTVNFTHNVNLLTEEDAICLLSKCAFGKEVPDQGYEQLSREVVHYAKGLPLTIKILGSDLCGRIKEDWKDAIERLKTIPEEKTLERLELSYIGLKKDEREIFLDVACILKGQKKDKAIKILESVWYHAKLGLKVLEEKSMINVSSNGHLLMHDLIEEMARNIVRRDYPDEPQRHSRLWIDEEIEAILVNKSGTKETRSICFPAINLHPTMVLQGFKKMKKLRILYVSTIYSQYPFSRGVPDEVELYLPNSIVAICWPCYCFSHLPKTFQGDNLVSLDMTKSNICQLWEGGERKVLKSLRFLDLSDSKLITFNLSLTPNLEELNLKKCYGFVELHMPIECSKLKLLNLSHSKVTNLNLRQTPNLERLYLNNCKELSELHMPLECPKLKFLDLRSSKVRKLNLGLTPNLEELHIQRCYEFSELRMPFACPNLKILYLGGFMVHDLKPGLLPVLDMCESLEELYLSFEDIQYLPTGMWMSKKLKMLSLMNCWRLKHLPEDIAKLERLKELALAACSSIQGIPKSICRMKSLKRLDLSLCIRVEELPEDIGKLKCLKELYLAGCSSIQGIPKSICMMKSLTKLDLSSCVRVQELPEEFGNLENLKELNIEGAGIKHLPESIYKLKGLLIIGHRWQLESYGFKNIYLDKYCCIGGDPKYHLYLQHFTMSRFSDYLPAVLRSEEIFR